MINHSTILLIIIGLFYSYSLQEFMDDYCDESEVSFCYVHDKHITIDNNIVFNDTSEESLLIENCRFECSESNPNCSFIVDLPDYGFSLVNSHLRFHNIHIFAEESLFIDEKSVLDANATGY